MSGYRRKKDVDRNPELIIIVDFAVDVYDSRHLNHNSLPSFEMNKHG